MDKADIPFLTATELAAEIRSRNVSPVEAVDAYLERIARVNPRLNAYISVTGEAARQAAQQAEEENRTGRTQRGASRRSGSRQGPDSQRGSYHHRCVEDPGGFRSRGGRDRPGQPETGRGHPAGQAEHERVCIGRPGQFRLRSRLQSMGLDPQPRNFFHRLRVGYRRVPLRDFFGRGHGRLHPGAGSQLRPRRSAADLGPGEPVWR